MPKVARSLLKSCLLATVLLLVAAHSPPVATAGDQETLSGRSAAEEALFDLSLDELLNVTVVSASRVEQSLYESPNAISVVTAADIDRAGARSVPDALRLVPGVYVAQMSGNQWVVTIGGFALYTYSNKLLVLVDGVSVYSPLHGGVNWGDLPVSIDEVERIEVIRGPGGVVYGANATNGVINIISRSPRDDQSAYAKVWSGNQDTRLGSAGVTVGGREASVSTRLGFQYDRSGGLELDNGTEIKDSRRLRTVSLRSDVRLNESMNLELGGWYKGGEYGVPEVVGFTPDSEQRLQNAAFRTRLDKRYDTGAQWYAQAHYMDQEVSTNRDETEWRPAEAVAQMDVEVQGMLPVDLAGEHKLIAGGGYRQVNATTNRSGTPIYLLGGERDFSVANAFVHDQWRFARQWTLNTGLKHENISVTEPTWQWRGALMFDPSTRHGLRLALANSYRSPSLVELYEDLHLALPFPVTSPPWPPGVPQELSAVIGSGNLQSESVVSYEVGYRGLWLERVGVDLSYAFKQYDHLIAIRETFDGIMFPGVSTPLAKQYSFSSDGEATSQNVELGLDARINEQWRLLANYGYVDINVDGIDDLTSYEDNAPTHVGRLGLSFSHWTGFMADAAVAYSGGVTVQNVQSPTQGGHNIDGYWRVDTRVARRFSLDSGELEVGLLGTNLGSQYHVEYVDFSPASGPLSVSRGLYGYLEYRVIR